MTSRLAMTRGLFKIPLRIRNFGTTSDKHNGKNWWGERSKRPPLAPAGGSLLLHPNVLLLDDPPVLPGRFELASFCLVRRSYATLTAKTDDSPLLVRVCT